MNPGDLVDPEETVEVGLIRTAIKGGFGFVPCIGCDHTFVNARKYSQLDKCQHPSPLVYFDNPGNH